MAGKGSKPRPVIKKKFDNNFDEINWVTKQGQEIKDFKAKKGKKVYKY